MITMDNGGYRAAKPQIEAALAQLGQALGVNFSIVGGQLGTTDMTLKLRMAVADTSVLEAQAKNELNVYGRHYGLTGNDYGVRFFFNNKYWKLVGVSPNRPKYPLDAIEVRSGKTYKLPRSAVQGIIDARPKVPAAPIAGNTPAPSAPTPTPNHATPGLEAFAQF